MLQPTLIYTFIPKLLNNILSLYTVVRTLVMNVDWKIARQIKNKLRENNVIFVIEKFL